LIRRLILGAALVAALAMPTSARAHEGHPHKIMGTVSTRQNNQLEVKTTDGKTSTIVLNEKTRIVRGKTRTSADGIEAGERIVVTATEKKGQDGKTTLTATEIRLAERQP
jgi:hypothetical protein